MNDCRRRNLSCNPRMTIPQLEKIVKKRRSSDAIYNSLRAIPTSHSGPSVRIEDEIDGKRYVPVLLSGKWKQLIDAQTDSLRTQNKGTRSLKTKKSSSLFQKIDTILIGDSYARLMEPPPPFLFVIAYPGIPLRSLDRSFSDYDRHDPISQKNRDPIWIHPQLVSPTKKSKKLYLSYGSAEDATLPLKRMFFEFSSKMGCRDMFSYPRVDIFRELIRFPDGQIKNLVFWMGNAELQITFFYKLFNTPFFYESTIVSPRFTKSFNVFVNNYVKECVKSYTEFVKMIYRLYPKLNFIIILMNYSPVTSKTFQSVLAGMKGFSTRLSAIPHQILQFVFDNNIRRNIVDLFNNTLLSVSFIQKHVRIVDINPIIFNHQKETIYPRFILHPRDIHIADPKREVYHAIVEQIKK